MSQNMTATDFLFLNWRNTEFPEVLPYTRTNYYVPVADFWCDWEPSYVLRALAAYS